MDGRIVRGLHPIRQVARRQGRRLTWIAEQADISTNYLHRILTPPTDPDHRPAPEWFYSRIAEILGVPEESLRPEWEQRHAA